MQYTAMEQYWIWLSSVEGITPKRFYRLLSIYEDARNVWDHVGDSEMQFLGAKALENLRAARDERYFYNLFSQMERAEMRAIARIHPDYPASLGDIYDPPVTLYVRGRCPLVSERMFAIVGSRRNTRDGARTAREFAKALAAEDVVIVSGMARGIDTFAHEGALDARGRTIAVLGCGADIVYPPENDRLAAQILESGGAIVSEYAPGTRPLAQHFPARNRIICGLTPGLLLVEAAKGSGAMITVNLALDQGRDVFAVPGSLYSPLSTMPNEMIQNGAQIALSAWDILEFYRWAQKPRLEIKEAPAVKLDETELSIVNPLREQVLSFDELAGLTQIPASKLNSYLTMLELRGIIVKVPGGMFRAYT